MTEQLVYVEFEDATSHDAWLSAEEVTEFGKTRTPVRQSGWLREETDDYLVISGQWCPASAWHGDTYGSTIRIPKGWIRTRITLVTVNEDGIVRMK